MSENNISDFQSNVIAYQDQDFLLSEYCRPTRLMLEYMKPEIMMHERNIYGTVVIFGSARTLSPEQAEARISAARQALAASPDDPKCQAALEQALAAEKGCKYYQMAREFARLATLEDQNNGPELNFVVTTGGGGGIMEAGNRGATEAGGFSIGVNITLPFEQHPNSFITPGLGFQMHYFSIRKMHFMKRAMALACFPGGFGTADELFEALTLVQTKVIKPIPIILFGSEFWQKLINWQQYVDCGLICQEDLSIFKFCDTAADGWKAVKDFYYQPGFEQYRHLFVN